MPSIIKYNTRVQTKIDTADNWMANADFIPLDGEIIVYRDLAKMKIGNGITSVNQLPFCTDRYVLTLANETITIDGIEYYPCENYHPALLQMLDDLYVMIGAVPCKADPAFSTEEKIFFSFGPRVLDDGTCNGCSVEGELRDGQCLIRIDSFQSFDVPEKSMVESNLADLQNVKAERGTFTINDSTSMIIDVPEDSANYAKIKKLGGMTRKCNNLIPAHTADTVSSVGDAEVVGLAGHNTFSISGVSIGDLGGRLAFLSSCYFTLYSGHIYTLSIYCQGIDPGARIHVTKIAGGSSIAQSLSNKSITFTVEETGLYTIGPNLTAAGEYNCTIYPMLVESQEAMTYEPYFEGLRSAPVTKIESFGANLFGGEKLVNTITSLPGVVATVNTDKTINFNADQIRGHNLFTDFEPNTQYTFIFQGWNTNTTSQAVNFVVIYTDGTSKALYFNAEEKLAYYLSDAGKTISALQGAWHTQTTYLYYEKCGVFKGKITEFLPYTHQILYMPSSIQALGDYGAGINESLYNFIDFEKKQYVQNVSLRNNLGDLDWTYYSDHNVFRAAIPDIALDTFNLICSMYDASPVQSATNSPDKTFYMSHGDDVDWGITIKDTSYIDATSFKEAVSGAALCYELSNPVITDISTLISFGDIKVQSNGIIVLTNEYNYNVPSIIEFYGKNNEIIEATSLIGDLTGTAARAIADEDGFKFISPWRYGLGRTIILPSQSAITLVYPRSSYNQSLISTNGPLGAAGGSYLVSCYAPGGAARTKVTRLMGSTDILYGILPQNTDDYVSGIVLFNYSNVSLFVNILVLTGGYPEIIEGDSGVSPYAYEADVPINSANVLNYAAPAGFGGYGEITEMIKAQTNAQLFSVLENELTKLPYGSGKRLVLSSEERPLRDYNYSGVLHHYEEGIAVFKGITYGEFTSIDDREPIECVISKNGNNWIIELVNPPMHENVEYRTTERWNGKPVYTRLVNFGSLPNADTAYIKITNLSYSIQFTAIDGIAIYSDETVPLSSIATTSVLIDPASGGVFIYITTDKNRTAWTAHIQLKYIKE